MDHPDVAIPALVDHHLHGVVTGPLDRTAFELLISESGAPPPAGTSHFDAPVGLAIRRHCAPVLDLDPHAGADDYLDRRRALGPAEVNRRFLSGAGLDLLMVETGHRTAEVANPTEMAALAAAPALEIVRVEAVAEALAGSVAAGDSAPSALVEGLGDALGAAAEGAVGLKTIVAYRYGFDLPVEPPRRTEVVAAARQVSSRFRRPTAAAVGPPPFLPATRPATIHTPQRARNRPPENPRLEWSRRAPRPTALIRLHKRDSLLQRSPSRRESLQHAGDGESDREPEESKPCAGHLSLDYS